MKTTRRILLVLLCMAMVMAATLPVCAVEPRLSHGVITSYGFNIDSAGWSELNVTYAGNDTTFTSFTVETYIQKRSLGFIWTKVDNGEPDKTWVDTSTDQAGFFVHTLQLESTGTYRAVFKFIFSGTGAEDDVIEDRVERTYG